MCAPRWKRATSPYPKATFLLWKSPRQLGARVFITYQNSRPAEPTPVVPSPNHQQFSRVVTSRSPWKLGLFAEITLDCSLLVKGCTPRLPNSAGRRGLDTSTIFTPLLGQSGVPW